MIVRYPWKHFDPSWVDYVNLVTSFIGTFCQFVNYMEVEWLPAYHPSEEEKMNPDLYAKNVRAYMSNLSGIPITNHSLDDALLQLEAFKYHLPADSVGFEVQTLKDAIANLNLNKIKQHLQQFVQVSKNAAEITVEQFAQALKMPLSPAIHSLFRSIDTDGNGRLNFREWLISLAFLNQKASELTRTMKFAFRAFDINGDGYVDREEFLATMKRINPTYWDQSVVNQLFTSIAQSPTQRISLQEFLDFTHSHPLTASLIENWATSSAADGLFLFTPSPARFLTPLRNSSTPSRSSA